MKQLIETPIDIQQFLVMYSGAIPYFDKLQRRGAENEKYYSADPFTDEQKKEYALKDRIPFSISSIPQKLNSIISTERTARVGWKAKVRVDPDDISEDPEQRQELFLKETKAELTTLRLKMIEKDNESIYKYSDIFASGVAVIYGVAKVWADVNKFGDPQIRLSDIDYKNFLWDVNSIEYEHNDCQWQAEKKYVYRIDLEKQYGIKRTKGLSIGDPALMWGRKKTQYYVNYNKGGSSDLDLLTVFEHYHKSLRDYYTVLFGGDIVSVERKKADAEKTLRMLQIPYLTSGQDLPPSDIIKTPRMMMDKYVFTYTDMLDYEETDEEMFPYSVYQAFFFKGKIWTMTDILKSMQQLANRMLAQIDYAFGVDLKNDYEIVMPYLDDTGLSVEQAIKMLKEDHYIPVNKAGTVVPIKSHGANPQWIQIMQMMIGLIDEVGGGRTFSGTSNSPGQSGKAIKALIGQGQLLTTAFIDNRNRFLQDFGKKVLWFMKKYDNAPYIMRVEGGALTPEMIELLQKQGIYSPSMKNKDNGFVKLNAGGENYLETSDYDLDIVEESLTDNKKEIEYNLMAQMEQVDPSLTLSTTWRRKKIEKITSLSYEDRAAIIKEIEEAQQQQAEAQQQQIQEEADKKQQELNIKKAQVIVSDSGNQVKEKTNVN